MFRLTLNSGYTASQERIIVVSRGLPVAELRVEHLKISLEYVKYWQNISGIFYK